MFLVIVVSVTVIVYGIEHGVHGYSIGDFSPTAAGFLLSLPILAVMLVIPVKQITGLTGFMTAVKTTFTVYGPARHVLVALVALAFIFTLVTHRRGVDDGIRPRAGGGGHRRAVPPARTSPRGARARRS